MKIQQLLIQPQKKKWIPSSNKYIYISKTIIVATTYHGIKPFLGYEIPIHKMVLTVLYEYVILFRISIAKIHKTMNLLPYLD